MADDALETQLRRLAALVAPLAETVNQHDARLARQDGINERLTSAIERLDRSIERIDQTLAHVEITQARIETLLARMIRHEDNGRDA